MASPLATHRDRLFAMGAAVLVAFAAVTTDLVSGFDRWLYDAGQRLTERAPSPDVAVVAIDDASLSRIGPWPWPRNLQARLIDQLSAGGAKVIVNTLPLSTPEDARGLDEIRRLARVAENDLVLGSNPLLAQELQRSATLLDTDTLLAGSIQRSRRTLLAVEAIQTPQQRILTPPAGVRDKVWASRLSLVPAVHDFRWPLSPMVRGAAGLGHVQVRLDPDEAMRTHDLLLTGNGRVMPSIALAAAAAFQGRALTSLPLRITSETLTVGDQPIATDGPGRLRPQFYPTLAAGRAPAFRSSFYEVLSGALPVSSFKGKVVFIGAVTPAVGPAVYTAVDTPVQPAMPEVEALAHITGSLLSGHSVRHPLWAQGLTALATLAVLALLWWGLPRWTAVPRTFAAVLAFVVPLAAAHTALTRHGLWVPAALPMLMVIAGYLAIGTFHLLSRAAGQFQSSAQQHGLQGAAALPLAGEVSAELQSLAGELDREGHAAAAAVVAAQAARLLQPEGLHEGPQQGLHPGPQDGPVQPAPQLPSAPAPDWPDGATPLNLAPLPPPATLGRYQLEEEIGRGAMGAVFAAHDPTIGRPVAIKTMALGAEFQGEALEDARARFFHEAAIIGRLQHPDIVTVYDAGEQDGLAYMAMERLLGKNLADHVLPGQRLPVPQVLRIFARVADALAYAHGQGVVHGDVKPANVVVDLERELVKVADFGIAGIVGGAAARPGRVIGTPYYMSPEQLAGREVDGRSDLYALGVSLFQVLTGVLPFRSESFGEFVHAVTHERAPDLRSLRPELPEALGNIVALALEKRPETRYANGRQMAQDLRDVADHIDAQGLPSPADVAARDDEDVIVQDDPEPPPHHLFGRPA